MYKVVVVGTDGSPTADLAVQAAADIARSWGSALHIVTAARAPKSAMASASGAAMVDSGGGQALAEEAAQQVVARSTGVVRVRAQGGCPCRHRQRR